MKAKNVWCMTLVTTLFGIYSSINVNNFLVIQYSRGGSRILQGRASNPSERGTGGLAPKEPRGVGFEKGAVPHPQKMFVLLISKWWLFTFTVNSYERKPSHLSCKKKSKKGMLIKTAGVRTPLIRPVLCTVISEKKNHNNSLVKNVHLILLVI